MNSPGHLMVDTLLSLLARTVFIYESLDVSATGFLAFHNDDKLQIVDIASGEEIGAIKEGGRVYSPAWSPDGHILAYIRDVEGMSEEGGRPVIHFSTADGLCQSHPLDLGVRVTSIDWSPDAEQLVFSTNEHGRIFFLSVKLGPGKMLLDSYQVNCLP